MRSSVYTDNQQTTHAFTLYQAVFVVGRALKLKSQHSHRIALEAAVGCMPMIISSITLDSLTNIQSTVQQCEDVTPSKTSNSVIIFGMTITRAENFCLPQSSTELIASAENTSDGFIWPVYVGVQCVSSRIETEAELDS